MTALTKEIEQVDSYKEKNFSALLKADKLLKDPPATTATPATKANAVRLPKLHLRHFNGDLTKWTTYWDHLKQLFIAIRICQNSTICPHYWRIQLEKRLSLTEVNYTEAASTLNNRFGGTQ